MHILRERRPEHPSEKTLGYGDGKAELGTRPYTDGAADEGKKTPAGLRAINLSRRVAETLPFPKTSIPSIAEAVTTRTGEAESLTRVESSGPYDEPDVIGPQDVGYRYAAHDDPDPVQGAALYRGRQNR